MKKRGGRAARVRANGDIEEEIAKICEEVRWEERKGRKVKCCVNEHSV